MRLKFEREDLLFVGKWSILLALTSSISKAVAFVMFHFWSVITRGWVTPLYWWVYSYLSPRHGMFVGHFVGHWIIYAVPYGILALLICKLLRD